MFTEKIVESDAFTDMPLSAQALYFHINMSADDDGFVNNPKRISRSLGASEDDLKLLIAKRFLISFESGIVAVKHWRMHNTLRKDRYTPTIYIEEKRLIAENARKEYVFSIGVPLVDQRLPIGQPSLGQVRLGKYNDRLDINNKINILNNAREKILKDLQIVIADSRLEELYQKMLMYQVENPVEYIVTIVKNEVNKNG